MNRYSFIKSSTNRKVGAMPVTRTDKSSCPQSCGAFAGCYAKAGRSNIHWAKLDANGLDIDQLVANLVALPRKTLWRHNEAGDLAGVNEAIDYDAMNKIIEANTKRNLKGFTYTHKKSDINFIKDANAKGFTINISCDTVNEVKEYFADGISCVTIADNADKVSYIDDIKLVRCPAEYNERVTCADCKLCAKSDRDYVIKFTPHGISQKRIIPIQIA